MTTKFIVSYYMIIINLNININHVECFPDYLNVT